MARAGVLETQMVEVERDGVTTREPLWRALQIASHAAKQAAIIDALPRDVALRAITELAEVGAEYQLRVPWRSNLLEDIGENERDWAIARADAYPVGPHDPMAYLKLYVFRALVRAKVPIKRRWEHLYPSLVGASFELLLECARGLPDDRRAAVLAEHFSKMGASLQIVTALASPDLVTAFLESAEQGTPSFVANLAAMQRLARQNAAVREAVLAFEAKLPKPIELVVTSIAKPKTVDALSTLAKEQLRIAGRGYDQQDLDAAARLGENGDESSFHGFLELRTICRADGAPAYDMLLFMVDSGVIFEAGSTREIGALAQGGVVLTTKNEPLRMALQAASQVKKPRAPKARKKPRRAGRSPDGA